MLWLTLMSYPFEVFYVASYVPYWSYTNGLFKIFKVDFLTCHPSLREEPSYDVLFRYKLIFYIYFQKHSCLYPAHP